MTSTNIGQRIGAAGNQAAIVLTGAAAAGVPREQIVQLHGDLTADFVRNMETIQDGLEAAVPVSPVPAVGLPQEAAPLAPVQQPVPNGAAMIQNAFPGTTVASPAEAAAFTPAPAAIPGAADGDPQVAALWQEFFADPSKFWDNRADKRNPRAPDFKNKDNGDKALWLNDKKNPSWVPAQLVAAGI